jgi:hypothetical protein
MGGFYGLYDGNLWGWCFQLPADGAAIKW